MRVRNSIEPPLSFLNLNSENAVFDCLFAGFNSRIGSELKLLRLEYISSQMQEIKLDEINWLH